MNYKEELEKIQQKTDRAKVEKATLTERKRKLEEERFNILEELKKEGITEDKVEDNINGLEISIQEEIEKCQQILK